MTVFFEGRMHERLAISLAREIVSGRLPEGAIFPSSDELARVHDVSRTVARETVQALAASGMISVRHGKRTTVNGVSSWRFLDHLVQQALARERLPGPLVESLYEARMCLETTTARLCAERADEATLQRLAELARPLPPASREADRSRILGELVRRDRDFHGTIAAGSSNVILTQIVREVHRGLVTSWALDRLEEADLAAIATQHAAIAERLLRRDAEGAAAAMLGHLQWALANHATLAGDRDG